MKMQLSVPVATSWLIRLHLIGIAGMLSPLSEWFVALTPLNLIATAVLVFSHREESSSKLARFAALAFGIGFLVEVIGVSTGLVFGGYAYGDPLGPSLFGVPLLIGLNWLLLTYGAGHFMRRSNRGPVFRVAGGAALLTALDVLIEPVAIELGFWAWDGGDVPLQNYVAWFVISAALLALFERMRSPRRNALAERALFVQLGFFAVLCLLL